MSAATIAPPRFQLEIAAPKMLTAKEEIKLLREAYERNSGSSELRLRLVSLLVRMDHFEEAIALLELEQSDDFASLSLLYVAVWARETEEANIQARDLVSRAELSGSCSPSSARVSSGSFR